MKPAQPRVFLVTGNETLTNKDVFLEALMYHQKLKHESPLLVDFIPHHRCFPGKPVKPDRKSALPRFFEYYTDLDIPCITREQLVAELQGENREELLALDESFSSIFILGVPPRESNPFYHCLDDCIDHIVFLIRNDFASSSYLFNFINELYEKMIEKNLSIIISGIKRVEDAARFFARIRDEMKEMIDASLAFDYLGHLDFDSSRITFAKRRNAAYLKLFRDDSFHGNIKYISEKLEGLERFRTKTFFRTLADSVHE